MEKCSDLKREEDWSLDRDWSKVSLKAEVLLLAPGLL